MEPEIQAMSECYQALQNLDNEARNRVLNWLAGKYNLSSPTNAPVIKGSENFDASPFSTTNSDKSTSGSGPIEVSIKEYESVGDIFAKANPKTDAEKVLVVATFLQLKNELQDFVSYDVQKELKHLGHGVTNITSYLGSLESRKPKLIIQTRKEGKSRQAKKKYKVTLEGINVVKELLK